MKRIFLTVAVACMSVASVFAQKDKSGVEYQNLRGPFLTNPFGDNWSVSVGAGINTWARLNTVDGEKNIILHDIVSVKGYKDSLIVTYNNKTGKYIGNTLSADGEEIPVYEYQGTSLYKYDSEGQNGILLCTLPDDCIIDSLAPSDSAMSSGNYIGIPLREYVFDSRGYITGYQNTKNIAIVNYVTGEYIITQSS